MSRWRLPPLAPGDLVPAVTLVSRTNPTFHWSTAAGRYLLIGFVPPASPELASAVAMLSSLKARFDGLRLAAFLVAPDRATYDSTQDDLPGLRWFLDEKGAAAAAYKVTEPSWVLLDPVMRVIATASVRSPQPVMEALESLPAVEHYAGAPLVAPVLIVPRVFEPEFCRTLIELYDRQGGQPSGVMREKDGRTVGVMTDMKSRRDVTIEDEGLRRGVLQRLERRLLPEIQRTLQFRATRIERYLVACYAADEGGRFAPHRDNETKGTAHRRFAVSINLNSEFEGGDLRFPEFGPRTYRPPVGGAVVFCCSLQHEATRVMKGRRYAFLPFLYDEEGARIRQENLSFLDIPQKAEPQPAEKP